MKRRSVLGGLALLAGAAACGGGNQSPSTAKGNKSENDPKAAAKLQSDRAKLRMGFVGLCAFVRNTSDKYYKAGLIDPTNVKDPENNYFKKHEAAILIDSRYVNGGTTITGTALRELRLNTSVQSFQMWPLNGYNVDIMGLPMATETYPSLTGAIPIRDIYNGTIVAKWDEQTWVQSMIPILGGFLFSAAARIDPQGVYKCRWKLTGTKAPSKPDWNAIPDVPRALSDVTEYHSSVPKVTTITLTERKLVSPATIQIPTKETTQLEIWILNMPKKNDHTGYEMRFPHELQHAAGFYQLFTAGPGQVKVPIADPSGYPTSDPIFCPPAGVP